MATQDVKRGTVKVNGTELYHEVRGRGPALLFVSGATGDAGHWDRVVDAFAGDHTVVSYDRRGNSRSGGGGEPRPTSIGQQADDAAGLLDALGLRPAIAVGSSAGAIIVLALLERDPRALRAAVLHEPPLLGLTRAGPSPALARAFEEAERDPGAGIEAFLRVALGEGGFDGLGARLRERLCGNARVFFEGELPGIQGYEPDTERLRSCGVPLAVVAGRDNRGDPALGFQHEAAGALADRLGVPLREMTGQHVPYLTHPEAFVAELRKLLGELLGSGAETPEER